MKLLTPSQKLFFFQKKIKAGTWYMFPRFGFTVYEQPCYTQGKSEHMDTNPFTKSLDHEYFMVKEKINGFCRGNFVNKPHHTDFYLTEEELSSRDMFECLFLFLVCSIPMLIYNIFKGGVSKIEASETIKNLLLIVVASSVFVACNNLKAEHPDYTIKYRSNESKIRVIAVDSCEYILMEGIYKGAIIHKQNCKYCINRKK